MKNTLLTTLLVFKNTIREELIRSVHVYQIKDGKVREVEREFVFSESGSYGEMRSTPILRLQKKLCVAEVSEGYQNGVWLCIFSFHRNHKPQFSSIPNLLLLSRNLKLRTIPTLLRDLRVIYKLEKDKDVLSDSTGGERQGNNKDSQPLRKVVPVLTQDLNFLPYEDDMSESPDNKLDVQALPDADSAEKKKRASSDRVAKITLSELVKYFDIPIVEASRRLNVGLTVLKRKCREFGIPRWPHRKIKSLDSLIHEIQEEANNQESDDKAAALAAIEKRRMLESEKENIERKPFMDIQSETKKLRQDIFKRRHRARAQVKHNSTVSSSSSSNKTTIET
ncbi:protein RKD5-like [Arachis stenosperma]|uniref:protein RKD5-like n=1 Tax=Arachis stenosperma TaxID=217475 RepID=UPI0025AC35EB|nr:protein RKD5-like [Arachis stenosperma]